MYYLDGVSDRAAQAVRPNNLLHWEIIRRASSNGLEEYDMIVGAGIPGVARFKQTFGACERPHTYIFRHRSALARIARRLYGATAPKWRALQLRWQMLRARAGASEESAPK